MDTREVAQEVRLSRWAELLREQKNSGMNIKTWCEAQGVSRARFFYWQKKLREAALEELSGQGDTEPSAPEGWALCTAKAALTGTAKKEAVAISPEQMTVEVEGLLVTVGSAYPVEQLAQFLRELMKGC